MGRMTSQVQITQGAVDGGAVKGVFRHLGELDI